MPENDDKAPSPVSASALALVVIGICLTTMAMNLDGLVRGLGQGAGTAMILIGVAILSAHLRRSKRDGESTDGMWLPSRDEDPK